MVQQRRQLFMSCRPQNHVRTAAQSVVPDAYLFFGGVPKRAEN